MNAPSIYTWVPQTKEVLNLLYVPGILLGGVMAFLLVVLIYKSQAEYLTPSTIIELSLISFMLIPFFLPKMHKRLFLPCRCDFNCICLLFSSAFLYSDRNERCFISIV